MPCVVSLLSATRYDGVLCQFTQSYTYVHTVCGMYSLPSHLRTPLPPYTPPTTHPLILPLLSYPTHVLPLFFPCPSLFPTMPLPLLSHAPPPVLPCPSPLLCRYPKEAIQPPCQSTTWITPSQGTTSSSSAASATTSQPSWPTARDTDRELGSTGGEGVGNWHHTWGVGEFCTSQGCSIGTIHITTHALQLHCTTYHHGLLVANHYIFYACTVYPHTKNIRILL